MQSLEVLEFAGDAAEWDDYVRGQSEGTFCHLYGWRGVFARTMGHRSTYLAARDSDGRLAGVLPLVRVTSLLFGDYLVSMPFLNYGGALGTDTAMQLLNSHARRLAEQERVKLLELRSRHAQPPSELTSNPRKVTVLLPLPEEAETLWNQFPSKLRSQIRRSMKEQLDVRFGSDQRAAFYSVFRRNMHALGTPVLPYALFEDMAHTFAGTIVFSAVYWNGEPIAGACGFVWKDEFEITWASSLQEHNSRACNMLLYWSLMEHVIGLGVRTFNFGRCTPDGGTHRFKLQWGGDTVALPWEMWSARPASAPDPHSPAFQLATRAWTRLPPAFVDRVGPRLARILP